MLNPELIFAIRYHSDLARRATSLSKFLSEIDQDGLRGGMEVIMITAYANKASLRESFRKYRVADFVDKFEFKEEEFVAEVFRVVSETVNLNLDVEWESRSQRDQVVLNLEITENAILASDGYLYRLIR